jgi:drug/metabolite transporter (DMT)-like permease
LFLNRFFAGTERLIANLHFAIYNLHFAICNLYFRIIRPSPVLPVSRSFQNFLVGLLLVLITAVWGYTFPVVKTAISVYGVIPFLAVRFALASLCLALFCRRRLRRATLVDGGLIGLTLLAGYLFQTFGLHGTTASNCGLITGLFVVFALLLNRLLFAVHVSAWGWSAVGISVVGLTLLSGTGHEQFTLGDLFTLGAALCYGLQVALLDRWSKPHDPFALAWTQVTVVALILLTLWPVVEKPAAPPPDVWFALALTAVAATAGGFLVQVLAQQRLSAVRCAMLFTLEPVFAALFGYLVAGDCLAPPQLAGAVLMVVAVLTAEAGTT